MEVLPLPSSSLRQEQEQQKKKQQHDLLYLKTISIHNSLQLTEIKKNLLYKKEPVILIARITPIMLESPEEGAKLLNELYFTAIKNNYSVFRLGEERIIIAPPEVQVEREEGKREKGKGKGD
jgi:SepF-like predicted cell division protein (DUF552 family)